MFVCLSIPKLLLEGDLEGDYKGDFRGNFKQELEGDLLSSSGQLRSRSGLVQYRTYSHCIATFSGNYFRVFDLQGEKNTPKFPQIWSIVSEDKKNLFSTFLE